MTDQPFDSMRLTNEAMDRCPVVLESMHQFVKAVVEVLDEWGFLVVMEPKEDSE